MSFAPTLPAPDLTDRQMPLSEEPRLAPPDNSDCLPFPRKFATPTRSTFPRHVAKLACLSLSAILRRVARRTDAVPTAPVSSALTSATVRRKIFGDARPNVLEDFTQFDELDPLPFINDDETVRDRRRFDHRDQSALRRDSSSFPQCIVVERRDGHGAPRPSFDRAGSYPVFECYLLDVNMSGIAIHTVRSFPRGSILDVRISTATSERLIETGGIVVRCEPWKAGGFQVVCRLEKFLRFAEIRDVGRDLFAAAIV